MTQKVFYIYNTDWKLLTGDIKVRVHGERSLNPATGKQEFDRGRAVTVKFSGGQYICEDPDIASYLSVYMDGGEYDWRGSKKRKEPNTFAQFYITDEFKLPEGAQVVKETVTKTAIPEFIIGTFNVDQLRKTCEEFKVPFTDIMGKQDLLDALKKAGHVS